MFLLFQMPMYPKFLSKKNLNSAKTFPLIKAFALPITHKKSLLLYTIVNGTCCTKQCNEENGWLNKIPVCRIWWEVGSFWFELPSPLKAVVVMCWPPWPLLPHLSILLSLIKIFNHILILQASINLGIVFSQLPGQLQKSQIV